MPESVAGVARTIDHALLNPALTTAEMEAGLQLALEYQVASVCLHPYYLRRAVEVLNGSPVLPTTVIGFPHGSHSTALKKAEAVMAISEGAMELDMVVNRGQVLSENWDYVFEEIRVVVETAHMYDRKVKVIFENCELQDAHKIRLCEICSELKADWVKTSTGFGKTGSTPEDLVLMRAHSAPHVQVKASGGLRTLNVVLQALSLGATRVGLSRTKEILEEARKRFG